MWSDSREAKISIGYNFNTQSEEEDLFFPQVLMCGVESIKIFILQHVNESGRKKNSGRQEIP